MRSLFLLLLPAAVSAQILPPALQSHYPAANATRVVRNTTIGLRFTAGFSTSFVSATLRQTDAAAAISLSADFVNYTSDGNELFYRAGAPFAPSSTYTVTITNIGPTDKFTYTFNFTTGPDLDTTPPRLVALTPDPNSGTAEPTGPFRFQFDEPLGAWDTRPNVSAATNPVVRVSADRRTVEVRAVPEYRIPGVVQVRFNPSLIRDMAGNTIGADAASARFVTTYGRDTQGPHLLAHYPSAGESDVPTSAVVQLLFDRPLWDSTIQPGIVLESRGQSVRYSAEQKGTLLLLRGALLLANTTYRVRLTTDLTDQSAMPIVDPPSFEFTTGPAPLPPTTEQPVYEPSTNWETGIPRNTRIVFRASSPLPSYAPLLFDPRALAETPENRRLIGTATILEDRRTLVLVPRDPLPAWSDVVYDTSRLTDIAGQPVTSSIGFRATGANDDEPPRVIASTPADRAAEAPPNRSIRIAFDERLGLMTPRNPLRLLRNGERVDGATTIAGNLLVFTPARALDPSAEYVVEVEGVADPSSNVMPLWTATFQTAADSVPPQPVLAFVRSSLQDASPDPYHPIEVQFNHPLSPAQTGASVTMAVQIPNESSPRTYDHPVRIEISGATARLTSSLPWPSARDATLNVQATDLWGRFVSYTTSFRARSGGDTARPEVLSLTPPSGTPVRAGDAIEIQFSEPMLTATAVAGLKVLQSEYNSLGPHYWSPDRRKLTLVLNVNLTSRGVLDTPVTLVASSDLTDLAGNPLRAVVARYPLAERRVLTPQLPSIVSTIPQRETMLDTRAPLTVIFSAPVDPAGWKRAAWLLTGDGRARGEWEFSADRTVATFRPSVPWPSSSLVKLFVNEPLIEYSYRYFYPTTAGPSSALTVVRSTLQFEHPANAVIEVEFDREPPAGSTPVVLTVDGTISLDQSRPRPRVLRLTPKLPLSANQVITIDAGSGVTMPNNRITGRVVAPLPTTAVELRYRSPVPSATNVARNARVSLLFTDFINTLSLSDSTVTMSAGGRPLLFRLSTDSNPTGPVNITPLDLLPANETIEVRLEGVEDRLGRPIAVTAWTFETGQSLDLTRPTLRYSNIPSTTLAQGFDPQAPVRLEYDDPLDPSALPNSLRNSDGSVRWELSPDLRVITATAATAWNRGFGFTVSINACDWSGNCDSSHHGGRAGFEGRQDPVVLRATSLSDGQTGVPLNVRLALLFDRPIGSDALRTVRLMRGDERILLAAPDLTIDGRVSFTPDAPLDPNTAYDWIVEGVQDPSGNSLSNPRVIRFTTGEHFDLTGITGALRSLSRSAIRVRLSEPIDLTTLMVLAPPLRWRDSSGSYPVPASLEWSEERLELTVTPNTELRPALEHTLNLTGLGDFAGQRSFASFTFAVAANPESAAVRIAFQPPDGSANVPTNAAVYATFSRSVLPGAVRLYEGDHLVAAFHSAIQTFRATFNTQLRPATTYRFESDAFRDEYGNETPAASATFTTGAGADLTSLNLVSTSPAQNEAGVAPETPWLFTFNKPLSQTVFLDFGPASTRQMPFRYAVEVNRENLILTPSPSWPAASTLSLTLFPLSRAGIPSVSDWAGNRLRLQTTVTFRTAAVNDPEPPVLESVSPPSGTMLPAGQSSLSLRFSKPVMIGSDGLVAYYGAQRVSLGAGYSADFRTLTITLQAPANSRVTVVGSADIRDAAENSLAPFVLEYPTGDAVPTGTPAFEMVEPRLPVSGSVTGVQIRFDRVMNAESVQQAFRLTQNGENAQGSIAVLEDGRAYRFTPSAPFLPGAQVRVFVLPLAVDLEGRPVRDDSGPSAQFTVPGAARTFSILQRGFDREAPADAILEVEFDREIDRSTVHGESVWLRRGTRLVAGHAALRDDRILQFIPDEPLEPGADYVLTAGAALRALDGAGFRGQDLRFRASEPTPAPEIESVEAVRWQGRDAVRVRFNAPLSPLAARGVQLERDGRAVERDALSWTDGREILLTPRDVSSPGDWTVYLDRVPARSGRAIPARRMPVSCSVAQVASTIADKPFAVNRISAPEHAYCTPRSIR